MSASEMELHPRHVVIGNVIEMDPHLVLTERAVRSFGPGGIQVLVLDGYVAWGIPFRRGILWAWACSVAFDAYGGGGRIIIGENKVGSIWVRLKADANVGGRSTARDLINGSTLSRGQHCGGT
jgi:hypothetical protein